MYNKLLGATENSAVQFFVGNLNPSKSSVPMINICLELAEGFSPLKTNKQTNRSPSTVNPSGQYPWKQGQNWDEAKQMSSRSLFKVERNGKLVALASHTGSNTQGFVLLAGFCLQN